MSRKTSFTKEIKFNSSYAIFSTGFAAMGLEIILLFAFQNHYGYLYQKIGLIVALFMAGLAGGAQIINQSLKKHLYNLQKILLGIEITITGFSLIIPFALHEIFQWEKWSSMSEPVFMVVVFFAGLLTGSEFPLINELLIKEGISAGKTAGKVNGYDHLGACLGGALTGTIFVPLAGTIQSCLFIAGLNLISCLFISYFLMRTFK